MVGRWSRFAISVNGTDIRLHLYCEQNYAQEEYKRSKTSLEFLEDSFLLIGHGGEVFLEKFKVIKYTSREPCTSVVGGGAYSGRGRGIHSY